MFFNFLKSISETFNCKRCPKLIFYKAKRLNSVVESWTSGEIITYFGEIVFSKDKYKPFYKQIFFQLILSVA